MIIVAFFPTFFVLEVRKDDDKSDGDAVHA